jgi:hypothetical protein
VPGMSGKLVARHHMGGATARIPVGARRHVPVSSAWLSPGASLGVFKDRPSIDMGSSRQLLRGLVGGGWPLRCPRFGPTLPGVESCSAFTVSHRPGGLLRVLSCGFVAPRCRSWGSSSFGPAGRLLSVPGGRAVLVDASALRSFSLVRSRPSFEGSCLPAVRLPGIRSVRLQGLAPRVKSAAAAGVATCCRSLLPWAFLPQAAKKGFTFSAISTARSLRPCRGGSSFPTCHLALGLLAKSRAFGFGPYGLGPWPERWCGCRFGLPKQREARGAVGSFWFRFRSVPDASIRSRLESARGVGPCLSLATMTPATRNLDESLEI